MQNLRAPNRQKPNLITTKSVFVITLLVMTLTIIGIWLWGLGKERTIIENSLLSTTILSIAFFLFITIGLYRGFKLKDNVGEITDQIDLKKLDGLQGIVANTDIEMPDVGDGIGSVILGIFLWIVITIILGFLLWLFGVMLWMTTLVFIAMLYWIFFQGFAIGVQ